MAREPWMPFEAIDFLAAAEYLFSAKELLVLNGDSYSDFNIDELSSMHESREAVVTAVLAHVDNSQRYGAVETNREGGVAAWQEKGPGGPRAGWINAGIYLINIDVLRIIRESRTRSLERELFPSLIGKGLFAFRHPGSFIDIGTPQSLTEADVFVRIREDTLRR